MRTSLILVGFGWRWRRWHALGRGPRGLHLGGEALHVLLDRAVEFEPAFGGGHQRQDQLAVGHGDLQHGVSQALALVRSLGGRLGLGLECIDRARHVEHAARDALAAVHVGAAELAEVGTGYLLGCAAGQQFFNGFFDQKAQLWSEKGALLATSNQIVYYKE